MSQITQHRAAPGSMAEEGTPLTRDWDALRVFLAIAEAGSIRSAAAKLRIQDTTVMRRIDALEDALRVTLFHREKQGMTLTDDGLSILADVRRLADDFRTIERKIGWKQYKNEGAVSLATTDGLGAFWIGPRLKEFQRSNPNIRINLKCGMDLPEVLNKSADITLQYLKPTQPELKIARIGRLHMLPYASKDYLATYGVPTSLEQVSQHRYVVQVATQLDENLFLNFLGAESFSDINAYQTNTSTTHYSMIVNGQGIGVLPTYLGDTTPNLVRLGFKVEHALDIYLSYRPAIGSVARVRRVIDWIKSVFNPKLNPHFADEPPERGAAPSAAMLGLLSVPIGSTKS